jgi:hypothetical protein
VSSYYSANVSHVRDFFIGTPQFPAPSPPASYSSRLPPLTGVPSVSSYYASRARDLLFGITEGAPAASARTNLRPLVKHAPLIKFTPARKLELESRVEALESMVSVLAPRLVITMGFTTFLYGVCAMLTLVISDMTVGIMGGAATNV